MLTLHPQFVTDADGHRTAVMLPAEEFDQLLEALDMSDDVAAYVRAKADDGQPVPYDQVRRELGLAE